MKIHGFVISIIIYLFFSCVQRRKGRWRQKGFWGWGYDEYDTDDLEEDMVSDEEDEACCLM